MNQYNTDANHCFVSTEEIGQIYQQDGGDLEAALASFEQAGDWYSGEDATACVFFHQLRAVTLSF